jgi:hypothetical protein
VHPDDCERIKHGIERMVAKREGCDEKLRILKLLTELDVSGKQLQTQEWRE